MFRTGFLVFVCLTLVLAATNRIAFCDESTGAFACTDNSTDDCWARGSGAPGIPSTCVSLPDPCVMTSPTTSCSCQGVVGDATKCSCR